MEQNRRLILILEDYIPLQQLLVRVLERSGYRVIAVGNGHQGMIAISQCKEHVDVILSDVDMPGMGGIPFASWVEASNLQIPIVLTSASHDLDGTSWPKGIVGFVPKPFTPDQIRRSVASACLYRVGEM